MLSFPGAVSSDHTLSPLKDCAVAKCRRNNILRRALGDDHSGVQQDRTIAQRLDRLQIVADKQNRAIFLGRDRMHLAEAFFLKLGVADRQHLVDDQDFRLQMRRDRKGQPTYMPLL